MTRPSILLLCALTLCSCRQQPSESEARKLIEHYNSAVSEAYRRGDVKLIDPVVGPNEGRKLTGLIGVRLDMGLTLDSELLELDIAGIARNGNELEVRTREKWSYRDLRIGTGEQVGEASVDHYEMRYLFIRQLGTWVVDRIDFITPPQVGRQTTPWSAPPRLMHGTVLNPAEEHPHP